MTDWHGHARKLAAELTASGSLTEQWRPAFEQVPRHVFLPDVSLAEAYANDAVVTQRKTASVNGGDTFEVPTSSASAPDAVAVMLDRLDVHTGMSVLEIGTGTGYNAALLSHQLGDTSIYSIDLDPSLVAGAREALELAGFDPTLRAGDGFDGMPEAGLFDRIIATCSIGSVPPAWIRQLKDGGRIVAPFLDGVEGGLVVLDKAATGEVVGRFDPYRVAFMPLREQIDNPWPTHSSWDLPAGPMPHYGITTLDPAVIRDATPDLLLWIHLHLPKLRVGAIERPEGPGIMISRPGAVADAALEPSPDGRWVVLQRGQSRLWDTVEHAVAKWNGLDQPGRDRLGITATDDPDRQYVWLDDPDGLYSWPLPLETSRSRMTSTMSHPFARQ